MRVINCYLRSAAIRMLEQVATRWLAVLTLEQVAEFNEELLAVFAKVIRYNQFTFTFHVNNVEIALIGVVADEKRRPRVDYIA